MVLTTSSGNGFPPSSAVVGNQVPSRFSLSLPSPLSAANENENTSTTAAHSFRITRHLRSSFGRRYPTGPGRLRARATILYYCVRSCCTNPTRERGTREIPSLTRRVGAAESRRLI